MIYIIIMKKLFFIFVCSFFAINVFAAGPSCTVYGGRGAVVELSSQSATARNGYVEVWVKVVDNYQQVGSANVLVKIYDAMTDNLVDAINVSVPLNGRSGGSGRSYNVKDGKAYYFKIEKAVSCQ